jgi:hypothetical protein
MSDLIEALQILLKYGNPRNPTHCSHDELRIMEIDPCTVSAEDRARLSVLGFDIGHDFEELPDDDERGTDWTPPEESYFYSFRFGSA